MEIKLSKVMKELRIRHGNTQEELADFLGVTIQAVSKWERAEGMPDITYLPQIAGFYAVTVDTLLGMDEAAKEEKIKEICQEYDRIRQCPPRKDGTLIVENNIEAGIDHIRAALHEFPDCWHFMQLLASDLWYHSKSKAGNEKTKLLDEAEGLCRKILNGCMEDRWRHCANEILCLILFEQGNKQQAVEQAWNLPGAVGSNDFMLTNVLEGADLERQLNISIREFIRLTYLSVQKLNENGFDKRRLREQEYILLQIETIMNGIYAD
ncbi:MAG: helix-turn-helix transcriptional regulator [Ruminococcaceae bacterium]|nr:helix-turn-helix transcriptional regulator [Oscillospiraceae bacterium]